MATKQEPLDKKAWVNKINDRMHIALTFIYSQTSRNGEGVRNKRNPSDDEWQQIMNGNE